MSATSAVEPDAPVGGSCAGSVVTFAALVGDTAPLVGGGAPVSVGGAPVSVGGAPVSVGGVGVTARTSSVFGAVPST